ncbi:MAG: hypothetical protein AAFR38_06375 [Planctomycetota bacterium]
MVASLDLDRAAVIDAAGFGEEPLSDRLRLAAARAERLIVVAQPGTGDGSGVERLAARMRAEGHDVIAASSPSLWPGGSVAEGRSILTVPARAIAGELVQRRALVIPADRLRSGRLGTGNAADLAVIIADRLALRLERSPDDAPSGDAETDLTGGLIGEAGLRAIDAGDSIVRARLSLPERDGVIPEAMLGRFGGVGGAGGLSRHRDAIVALAAAWSGHGSQRRAVSVAGSGAVSSHDVQRAGEHGRLFRLVATAELAIGGDVELRVGPLPLRRDDPLSRVGLPEDWGVLVIETASGNREVFRGAVDLEPASLDADGGALVLAG